MTPDCSKSVLVVDDEPGMRMALQANFQREGWMVQTAAGAAEAVRKFAQYRFPLVVTDVRMPDGDGLQVMRSVRSSAPGTAVIILTAFGSVPEAVEAMHNGACDYLMKPFSFDQLQSSVGRVMQRIQQPAAVADADNVEIIGTSPILREALERARQAARTDADVLIEAESGAGKELVARFIHEVSNRRSRPFVAVNCAALPEHLLESELFGHVKGAFTGATAAKPGKFELADGGTLLLDEIGEMPLALQPKLLRVLQEREFERLGDTRAVRISIRIIATTNAPLFRMVEEGAFRPDLYYRLNVIPLALPALREHVADIPELARHFVALYSAPGRTPPISSDLLAQLQRHRWPGNVRELANLMRRAVALGRGKIDADAVAPLPFEPGCDPAPGASAELSAGLTLEAVEKRLLQVTLDATGGNRSRAAEMLGVSLRTVRNKIRDYGLPPRRSYARS